MVEEKLRLDFHPGRPRLFRMHKRTPLICFVSAAALATAIPSAQPALLTGTPFGTPGSWNNSGNTFSNVFDGNLTTFFDAPDPGNFDWAGLDFRPGASDTITAIAYCPRSGFSGRMVGGVFQGANLPDFSDAVTLFTLNTAPTEGVMTTQALNSPNPFRYARYLAPSAGWGNISELQFFGYGPGVNLALGQPTAASSGGATATNAVDGKAATSWASAVSDPQWLYVDLGSTFPIGSVNVNWGAAYAKAFEIQVSSDASTWSTVYSSTSGSGGAQTITFAATNAQFVSVYGTQQGNAAGYSLSELSVFTTVTAPTVGNAAAGNVQSAQATLNGTVISTGGETPNVVLYYGPSDSGTTPGAWANQVALGPQASRFSQTVTSLTANTTYYSTASASNSAGVSWASPSISFATPAPATLPIVTNLPASNVQGSSAVLAGQVVDSGGGGETPAVTIYYGTSDGGTNSAAWDNNIYFGQATGEFDITVTGLTTNTLYYFTSAAVNSAGTAWAPSSGTFTTANASPLVSALTWHYDNTRQGVNTNESTLTPANVNVGSFGKLFSYTVDGHIYAQPLILPNVSIPGKGTHNVVYVATQHNSIYAFDADSNAGASGGLIWHTNMGTSSATPNNDYGNRYGPYHDINPEVGITGTPVIDPASGTIYFDVFTHEGTQYFHRIHALDVATGAERPYAPVLVTASVPGVGVGSSGGVLPFSPIQSLQRPAMTLVGGILFVVFTGYADTDPYHGWVLGYEASTLRQFTNYIFNTSPNSTIAVWGPNAGECGIWMAGNGLCVDANTNLYFEVGNGPFNANTAGGTEYGDSFVKLAVSNTLQVADYFTPYNQASLASADSDLGSGGPLLLPDAVGSAPHPHLIVGCGKQGSIYLVDRDNMGHYNSANDSQIVQSLPNSIGGTWSSPAYFNHRIYYHGNGDVLKAFTINNASISLSSSSGTSYGYPGATPVVSANGTQNGIVWDLQTDAYGSSGPTVLHAYNATNVAQELYNTSQNLGRDNPGGAVKYTVPVVANGKVYVGAQFALSVFGNGAFLATPVIAPNGGVFTNSVTVSISVSSPGATLYYTIDGTPPTTNSILYQGSFVLTNSAVVQAIAAKSGSVNSGVASASFLNSSAIGHGTGLLGQYWSNHFPTAPFTGAATVTRADAQINFNWGNGSPDPKISVDNFTARWTGAVEPQFNETYTFYATTDDGVRLFINGQQIINQWVDQAPTESSGTIALRAQERYNIEMDYYEHTGGAMAILSWSSLSTPKALIPTTQLYPTTNPPPGVVLNSPANGATYTAPASVTVGATAAAQYNSIDSVAFFANSTLLGTMSNSPYVFTATGLASGNYTIKAVVTDGSGLTGTSAPVNVTISSGSGAPYGLASRSTVQPFLNMPQLFDTPQLPAKLSQTGAFTDTGKVVPITGLIPYAPNTPLWSDGALKNRWMSVPYNGGSQTPDQQITFAPTGEWAFPNGTVFVKEFDLVTDETNPNAPHRRLETRVLVRDVNGGVYGVTYKWRADNSDADLLSTSLSEDIIITNSSGTRTQTWYYPSPADCLTCHTPAANYVLGVKTRQLNGNFTYPASGVTDNQLRSLNHIGLFNPGINEASIGSFAQLVSITNDAASLEDRFRSYIDANCAQCHRPGGTGPSFDARYDTPLTNQNIINGSVLGNLGYDNAHVVTPRDIWRSILYQRANSTDNLTKMPQLARNLVDSNAMTVVAAWINSLPGAPALQPPSITPAGGTFAGPVAISLQDSDTNATLRYTLDGSLPTASSTLYAGPFLLTNSAIIKAKAFETGFNDSVAAQAQFAVAAPTPVVFLPGSFFTNGTFQMRASGVHGDTYVLQGTTNFFNWAPINTNVPPTDTFNVLDGRASNFQWRFYRLIQVP
jgi:uncharacterized repeat protein (TIGR03806 family)